MQNALDDLLKKENEKAEAMDSGDLIVVNFKKSGRYYNIDKNGQIEKVTPYNDTTPGELAQNSDGEYMIESIEDLVVFSTKVNIDGNSGINVVLMRDLDFNSSLSYSDSQTTIYNEYLGVEEEHADAPLIEVLTKHKGFRPIGTAEIWFSGTFDGNDHKIKNLYENADGCAGLFGYISRANIKNIEITGNITSTDHAGGIAGVVGNASELVNCTNHATIDSINYVGGIIGWLLEATSGEEITFKSCANYGTIKSSTAIAGGIIGTASGDGSGPLVIFSDNCNYGNVYGEAAAGGLVGEFYNIAGCILNCLNGEKAVIESNDSSGTAGGILGGYPYTIYNCINLGKVKANIAGGITGSSYGYAANTITNCYSVGKIYGTDPKGINGQYGAVGTNCYYLLSDTVGENESGVTTEESTEVTHIDKLTTKEINVLNGYIGDEKNIEETAEWKNWTLDKNGTPKLVEKIDTK